MDPNGVVPGDDTRDPAYLRIANVISDRIGSGVYRPNDQLPTEKELRAEFGVSPVTVRRAVSILLDRGLVTTTRGRGTFVRGWDLGEAIFRLQEMRDIWADTEAIELELLEARIIPASEQIQALLERETNCPTVFLRRLIRHRGVPIIYHTEHVVYDPRRPLVEAQLQVTSLDGLLRSSRGTGMPSGELNIQACGLDEDAAHLLDLPEGSPAFCLEHVFRDFDGRPVSWGRFLCRPDRFRLTTRIGVGPRYS